MTALDLQQGPDLQQDLFLSPDLDTQMTDDASMLTHIADLSLPDDQSSSDEYWQLATAKSQYDALQDKYDALMDNKGDYASSQAFSNDKKALEKQLVQAEKAFLETEKAHKTSFAKDLFTNLDPAVRTEVLALIQDSKTSVSEDAQVFYKEFDLKNNQDAVDGISKIDSTDQLENDVLRLVKSDQKQLEKTIKSQNDARSIIKHITNLNKDLTKVEADSPEAAKIKEMIAKSDANLQFAGSIIKANFALCSNEVKGLMKNSETGKTANAETVMDILVTERTSNKTPKTVIEKIRQNKPLRGIMGLLTAFGVSKGAISGAPGSIQNMGAEKGALLVANAAFEGISSNAHAADSEFKGLDKDCNKEALKKLAAIRKGLVKTSKMTTCKSGDCYGDGITQSYNITRLAKIANNETAKEGAITLNDVLANDLDYEDKLNSILNGNDAATAKMLANDPCIKGSWIRLTTKCGKKEIKGIYGDRMRIMVYLFQNDHKKAGKPDGAFGNKSLSVLQDLLLQPCDTPTKRSTENCTTDLTSPSYLKKNVNTIKRQGVKSQISKNTSLLIDPASPNKAIESNSTPKSIQTLTKTVQAAIDEMGKASLVQVAAKIGNSKLQKKNHFDKKGGIATEIERVIYELSENGDTKNLNTVRDLADCYAAMLANKLEKATSEMTTMGDTPERKAYSQILDYLIKIQGLAQLKTDGKVLEFNHYVDSGYAALALEPINNKIYQLEYQIHNAESSEGYVDHSEIEALRQEIAQAQQEKDKLLGSLNPQERESLMLVGEVKVLKSQRKDTKFIYINEYNGLPDFHFTKDGKASLGKTIDSLLWPLRAPDSLVRMAWAKAKGQSQKNTPEYENAFRTTKVKRMAVPKTEEAKKGFFRKMGSKLKSIVTKEGTYKTSIAGQDNPFKARYHKAVVENNEGEKTNMPATKVFDNDRGNGVVKLTKDRSAIDWNGQKLHIEDHNRMMALVKVFWAPETLKKSDNFLKQALLFVANIDFKEIFHIDFASPDKDLNIELSKKNFAQHRYGRRLIRQANGNVDCAWETYCTLKLIILGRTPDDAFVREDIEEDVIAQSSKNDQMIIPVLLKKLYDKLTEEKKKKEGTDSDSHGPYEDNGDGIIDENDIPVTEGEPPAGPGFGDPDVMIDETLIPDAPSTPIQPLPGEGVDAGVIVPEDVIPTEEITETIVKEVVPEEEEVVETIVKEIIPEEKEVVETIVDEVIPEEEIVEAIVEEVVSGPVPGPVIGGPVPGEMPGGGFGSGGFGG